MIIPILLGSAILLLGIVLRMQGLASQPPFGDEVEAAFTAVNYMENGQFGPTMWFHPNLRNIVQYSMMGIFGHGPFALRGMSLFAGILSIPLAGMLVHSLTKNRTASLLAAFLLAVEQVHVTFSRQAIQETWTTFFILLAVLLFVGYAQKQRPWMLVLSGVVFGVGTASKFHPVFPLLACLAAGLYLSWKERSLDRAVFVACALTLLPFAVFLLTYLPWFGRGYGLMDWVSMQKALLNTIATTHGSVNDQILDIAAWKWFLRPNGYVDFVFSGGRPYVTIAYSNPVVWLLVIPATITQILTVVRRKADTGEVKGIFFILLLFAISYLPLALSPRPIWLLSSLAVIPFAFMIVTLSIDEWVKKVAWGKQALIGYIALVLLSSAALYPMAIGESKSYRYLHSLVEKYRPAFESNR